MEKISLKDVKNSLKRDEMRMISGGSGGDTARCYGACTLYVNGKNEYGSCRQNGSSCGCSWAGYSAGTCRGQ